MLAFVEDVTAGTPKGQFTAVGSLVALPGAQAPSSAGSQLWDVGARRTRPEKVARLLSGSDPRLRLGQLAGVPDVGVAIVPKRLNRHTFWCGQSGSGKTYALGVFLERVLLTTRLPMVVFDPNSDFARLDEVSPSADPETAQALAALDVAVLRPGDEASPLRVAFTGLSAQAKAAVLRLDPIVDRREYNALLHLMAEIADVEAPEIVRHLRSLDDTDAEALAKRLENLGVLDWTSTWAYGAGTAIDVIDRRPAATVLDLGGYDRHEEQLTVALAVLEAPLGPPPERRPLLLVLDEAHNLCPPDPDPPRRGRARPDHPDRGGRAQVRAVAAALDPAPVEGPPRDRLPVRQPHPDADELLCRPRRARDGLRFRAGRPAAAGRPLPSG